MEEHHWVADEIVREEVDDVLLSDVVEEVLDTLTPREKKVIQLRFYKGMTQKAVGKIIGTQGERVRQIEAKALRKLRHPTRTKALWAAWKHVPLWESEEQIAAREKEEREELQRKWAEEAREQEIANRKWHEEQKAKYREQLERRRREEARRAEERRKYVEAEYKRQQEERKRQEAAAKLLNERKAKEQDRRVQTDYERYISKELAKRMSHTDTSLPPDFCTIEYDRHGHPYIAVPTDKHFSVDSHTYDRWLMILLKRKR